MDHQGCCYERSTPHIIESIFVQSAQTNTTRPSSSPVAKQHCHGHAPAPQYRSFPPQAMFAQSIVLSEEIWNCRKPGQISYS